MSEEQKVAQEFSALCMRCRTTRATSGTLDLSGKQPKLRGNCPVCTTKMVKFVPRASVAQ